MDFSQFKDINDFYVKTGMSRNEAFLFLLQECKRRRIL